MPILIQCLTGFVIVPIFFLYWYLNAKSLVYQAFLKALFTLMVSFNTMSIYAEFHPNLNDHYMWILGLITSGIIIALMASIKLIQRQLSAHHRR